MSTVLTRTLARTSAALTTDRAHRGGGPAISAAHAGGRLTLEQRLDSVWEGLRAGGAECPVCHAAFTAAPDAATARCEACGSRLS